MLATCDTERDKGAKDLLYGTYILLVEKCRCILYLARTMRLYFNNKLKISVT